MKKSLFSITAIILLGTTSCKKSDNSSNPSNPTGPTLPASYWKIDTTVYTPVISNYVDGALEAFGSSLTNDCIFDFNNASLPVAGTYKIVKFPAGTGEVSITASTVKEDNLKSIGTDNAKAIVTVNAGKITVAVSGALLVDEFTGDTVKISANLVQTQ